MVRCYRIPAIMAELGVQLARTEEPEVIILDIELPDIDGFEVCTRIRGFSSVQILMLTVISITEDIIRRMELDADDYVTKPFRPTEILARIDAILRRIDMTRVSGNNVVFEQGGLTIDLTHG
jgi:DNA-binding response OmpR family regulator